ncbi:MAG: DUF1329 domain-containing protein [Dehalococcoidia bacterium]
MIKQKITWSILFVAVLFMLFTGPSWAAVSADEARQLGGTTLTEFGAEKAGNADGSIPAYTGGLNTRRAGADRYEDPFKGEKPLYTIDAKNVDKYASLLAEGTRALIKRFPATYKIDVYPTHRTMRYPSWAIQNTLKNATTAKMIGEIIGDGMSGADEKGLPFAGVPFPIPKNGYEVMWNNTLHCEIPIAHMANAAWLVDTVGRITLVGGVNQYYLHPWYEKSGKIRKQAFDAVYGFSALLTSPPSSAGIRFLNLYMPNAAEGGQRVWFYTPGQRRVRRAPEFSYDIPIASYGGVIFWDEIFGFVGRMDRFDFKLVGKKEMIIPYNVFGVTNQALIKDLFGPQHVVPGTTRWEKHRVWIVDSTRKTGVRHAYSRRTFYIDEDSWAIVATESYDNAGSLWRVGYMYTFPTYDLGGINQNTWSFNDIIKGNYFVINTGRKEPGHFLHTYNDSEGLGIALTPQAVASGGVR